MENLTVIIVTYNTPEKIILDCLKSIDSKIKVLIIENSDNFYLKDIILRKFQNVEIYCTGKNLGYGSGNNFGISKSKTDYILILNPDVVCDKSFFSEISNVINKASDFSIIGCQYINDNIFMPAGFFDYKQNEIFKKNFLNKNFEYLTNVEWVTGCSMIINLKNFKTKKFLMKIFFIL